MGVICSKRRRRLILERLQRKRRISSAGQLEWDSGYDKGYKDAEDKYERVLADLVATIEPIADTYKFAKLAGRLKLDEYSRWPIAITVMEYSEIAAAFERARKVMKEEA